MFNSTYLEVNIIYKIKKVGDDKIQLCYHSMSVAVETSQLCCHKLTRLSKKFYRQIQHKQLTSMKQSLQVIF